MNEKKNKERKTEKKKFLFFWKKILKKIFF